MPAPTCNDSMDSNAKMEQAAKRLRLASATSRWAGIASFLLALEPQSHSRSAVKA